MCTGTPRSAPEIEPALLRQRPGGGRARRSATARRSRRPSRRRGRRRPRSSRDSRARQSPCIAGDVLAMHRQHRVAGGIGRNRDEEMRDPVERFPRRAGGRGRRASAGNPAARSAAALSAAAAGAADDPARGGEPAGQRQRAVAEAEAEEMRAGHDGSWPQPARLADARGSASSVSAMRLCLSRVHSPEAAGDERADRERQAQAEMLAERAHQHRADRRAGAEDHAVERHDPAAHPNVDRRLDQGLRADPGDRHRRAGDKDARQREVELVGQR